MNLFFKHVTAKNFMSFKNLDFDISRFDGKTVLISGYNDDIQGERSKNNGAGKSTLNNTILFAIYGEVLNPLKKAVNIRNWSKDISPKDDVEVTLTIIKDDIEYAIRRILKGKKCSGELHVFSRKASENKEWNEITLSTMAETQRMIETDIVPCGKDAFLRCVILTADQNKNFFKMKKDEKNSFFESLFGLTKYSEVYARLHRRTLDTTTSLTASSKSIDKFNSNIAKLKQDKEIAKKNQEDIRKAEQDVERYKKLLLEFENNGEINSEIENKKRELSEYKKTEIASMKSKMDEFDKTNSISETDSNHKIIFSKEDDNTVIAVKMAEYYKKCNLNVDLNGRIVFDNTELDSLEQKKDELNNRIINGKTAIRSLNEEINSDNSTISSIKSAIELLNGKIKNLKYTLKTHSKITDILCSDCITKYMDSVDISNYPSLIEEYEKDIPFKESELDEAVKNRDVKVKTLEKYEKCVEKLISEQTSIGYKIVEINNSRKSIQSERDSFLNSVKRDINSTHDEIQFRRDRFRSSLISNYKDKCSELDRAIEKLETSYKNKKDEYSRNIKNAEYRLQLVSESRTDGFDASIRSLTESLEKEKEEFDILTESISHYKALEEILKPENIRKSVVPDMLKELNFRICGYLSKMGSNYTCKFDDDFEATFISNTGTEAEYNNFSSGEHMRLSLACCLAFRDFMQVRLNFHPNMLVIDEFIDSNLDEMAVSGIMDMIRFMVGTDKISAFIISQRTEIKQDTFDHDILIRKKDDNSKIIIDGIE